jgi:hypothetical protein
VQLRHQLEPNQSNAQRVRDVISLLEEYGGFGLKVSSEGCCLATCASITSLFAQERTLTGTPAQSFELPVVLSA